MCLLRPMLRTGFRWINSRMYRLEEAKQARRTFESFMQENNVPSSDQKAASLSFGWLNEAPEGESFVGSYGRIFDVIAMSKPDGNTFRPAA